jgi:lysophospholipase L1-like esterase
MQHLDYLYATQVRRHKGATYLSSVPSLGGPGGSYTAFKTVDGSYEELRTDDGIHLQAAGAQLLGEAVISDMDVVYRLHLHP